MKLLYLLDKNPYFYRGVPDNPDVVDLDNLYECVSPVDGVTIKWDCVGFGKAFCEDDVYEDFKALLDGWNVRYAEQLGGWVTGAAIPNDTLYSLQWHHQRMACESAWDVLANQGLYRIGVIDSGILPHPDLNPNRVAITFIHEGQQFNNCVGVNVRVEQVGTQLVNSIIPQTNVNDTAGWVCREGNYWSNHGTHVAGIIAARGNNNRGMTGMVWNVNAPTAGIFNIFGLNRYDPKGGQGATWDDILESIQVAVSAGCKIVNMSLGGWGNTFAKLVFESYFNAASDVIFVIAAGNSASKMTVQTATGLYYALPAACECDNVITVASADYYNNKSWYSNYNRRYCMTSAYGGTAEFLRYSEKDIWATIGELHQSERGVFTQLNTATDTANGDTKPLYGAIAGTSMASPVCAGGVTGMMARWKGTAGTDMTAQKLRDIIRGSSHYHSLQLLLTCQSGGIYHHNYAMRATHLSALGYNPPQITVEEFDDRNAILIKLKNNDTATRNLGLKISKNRYCSPYETHHDLYRTFPNIQPGATVSFEFPLDNYTFDFNDTYYLCITAFCLTGISNYPFTYCSKFAYTALDVCPTDLINHPYIDVINVVPEYYFGDVPDESEWTSFGDANNLARLYRYAHIVLTLIHGHYMPPAGGLCSLSDNTSTFPLEHYVPRAELTKNDVIYGLFSLYKQLVGIVESGLYRYSYKFQKKVWFYPIDTKVFWGTLTLKRKRIPESWRDDCELLNCFSEKRIVFRIVRLLRSLSCMMGVNLTVEVQQCGASWYGARYWGINAGSFSLPVPACETVYTYDTTTQTIKVNDSNTNLRCDGSDLLDKTTGDKIYNGVLKLGSLGVLLDTRTFPFAKDAFNDWFFKGNKLFVTQFTYPTVYFAGERDLLNKTESGQVGSFVVPQQNAWLPQKTGYGCSHSDSGFNLFGNTVRKNVTVYNGTYGEAGVAFVGVFSSNYTNPGTVSAESFRTVVYKSFIAFRVVPQISDFICPIHITHWISNQMGRHASMTPETAYGLYQNNSYTFPTRQTLTISGEVKAWEGNPGNNKLVKRYSYSHALRVPINNSGVDYRRVADFVLDIDVDDKYSVIEDTYDLSVSKANKQATFMLHATPNQYSPSNSDPFHVCEGHTGNNYVTVLYGKNDETFATNGTWELLSSEQLMQPYPIKYWGVGTYTRDCSIASHFDGEIDGSDWFVVPDLRGTPYALVDDVLQYYGFSVDYRSNQFSDYVYGWYGRTKRCCVEQIPPAGYAFDKRVSPKTVMVWVQSNTSSGVNVSAKGRAASPIFVDSVPSANTEVYSVPTMYTPFTYTGLKRQWIKNESGLIYYHNNDDIEGVLNIDPNAFYNMINDVIFAGGVLTKDQSKNGKYVMLFPYYRDRWFVGPITLDNTTYTPKSVIGMYVYTPYDIDRFMIPNLRYMPYSRAKSLVESMGYELRILGGQDFIKFEGEPCVVSQFPNPGYDTFPFFFNYIKRIYVTLSLGDESFQKRYYME